MHFCFAYLCSQGDTWSHNDEHDEHIEEREGDYSVDTNSEGIFAEKGTLLVVSM